MDIFSIIKEAMLDGLEDGRTQAALSTISLVVSVIALATAIIVILSMK